LRTGVRGEVQAVPAINPSVLHAMTIAQVFDYLGTRVDGPRAGTRKIVINWRFSDTQESIASTCQHGALTSISGKADPDAEVTVTATRSAFESVILGGRTLADAIQRGDIATRGEARTLVDFWALLVDFRTGFSIVEP
jgi:alkyl sulfatase BDS1-like metallo-beta-lactamase superfamily hydrolase